MVPIRILDTAVAIGVVTLIVSSVARQRTLVTRIVTSAFTTSQQSARISSYHSFAIRYQVTTVAG